MYKYIFGNSTHVGQVRKANEDYFGNFDSPNGYIFVVCDGMGGHVGGAKASRIAVDTIKTVLTNNKFSSPKEAIHYSIEKANEAILGFAVQNPEYKGMGATCVMAVVTAKGVFIGHVGDSRIYLMSNGGLKRLTKDHSFVQTLVDMGDITEEQAEQHPRKNEITNALGLQGMKPPTIHPQPIYITQGDILLLCTDGLTGMVNDKGILQVLLSKADIQEKSDKLVDLANRAGGTDNITVQLVQFNEVQFVQSPSSIPQKKKLTVAKLVFMVLLPMAIIASGFIWYNKVFFHKRKQQISQPANLTDTVQTNTEEPGEIVNPELNTVIDGKLFRNDIIANEKAKEEEKSKQKDDTKKERRKKNSRDGTNTANNKDNDQEAINDNKTNQVTMQSKLTLRSISKTCALKNKADLVTINELAVRSPLYLKDDFSIKVTEVSDNKAVNYALSNNGQQIDFIFDTTKHGTTIFRVCILSGETVVSDTTDITIITEPFIDIKDYDLKLGRKDTLEIEFIKILKNEGKNCILGYDLNKVQLKFNDLKKDWVKVDINKRTVLIEEKKDADKHTFPFEIIYPHKKETLGNAKLIIQVTKK